MEIMVPSNLNPPHPVPPTPTITNSITEIKLLFSDCLSFGCTDITNVVFSDPRVRYFPLFITQGDGSCL